MAALGFYNNVNSGLFNTVVIGAGNTTQSQAWGFCRVISKHPMLSDYGKSKDDEGGTELRDTLMLDLTRVLVQSEEKEDEYRVNAMDAEELRRSQRRFR